MSPHTCTTRLLLFSVFSVSTITSLVPGADAANITLPDEITSLVPECATSCVEKFADANFANSGCGNQPTHQCLCSVAGTNGFTIGEGALTCLTVEKASGQCSADEATDAVSSGAYNMCVGQKGAAAETHSTLLAPSVLSTTLSTTASTSASSTSVTTSATSTSLSNTLSKAISSATTSKPSATTASSATARSSTTAGASRATVPATKQKHPGPTPAAIAGIVIAVIVALAALVAALFFIRRARRRKKTPSSPPTRPPPDDARRVAAHEMKISLPMNLNRENHQLGSSHLSANSWGIRSWDAAAAQAGTPQGGVEMTSALFDPRAAPNHPSHASQTAGMSGTGRSPVPLAGSWSPRAEQMRDPPTADSPRQASWALSPSSRASTQPPFVYETVQLPPLSSMPPLQTGTSFGADSQFPYQPGSAARRDPVAPNRDSIITEFAEDGEQDDMNDASRRANTAGPASISNVLNDYAGGWSASSAARDDSDNQAGVGARAHWGNTYSPPNQPAEWSSIDMRGGSSVDNSRYADPLSTNVLPLTIRKSGYHLGSQPQMPDDVPSLAEKRLGQKRAAELKLAEDQPPQREPRWRQIFDRRM